MSTRTEMQAGLWLAAWRAYLIVSVGAHLAWEIAQLPLYTLWQSGSNGEIAFAVLHCTAGDVMIASLALLSAQVVLGSSQWPKERFASVAMAVLAIGLVYTVFSEWKNVHVKHAWAYARPMPIVPLIGTGLAPLMQWVVVPVFALWAAHRRARLVVTAGANPDQP